MKFNFHRRTGLAPGFGISRNDYGIGAVYMLRLGWSATTLTFLKGSK